MGVVLSLGLVTTDFVTDEVVSAALEYRSMQAGYIAEAGVERAMRELKNTWNSSQDWSGVLKGADSVASTSDDGILSFGSLASLNGGGYSVVVTDNDDGDSDPFTDSDDTVVITSTGSASDGTSKTVVVEVSARPLNPDSTIYLQGDFSDIELSQELLTVSGDDYNIGADLPSTVGAAYAISTDGLSLEIPDGYSDNFLGKGYDPLSNPVIPSVLTSAAAIDVQALAQFYAQQADVVLSAGTYTTGFGSAANYQIIHVTGDVVLSGNKTSYGMLIADGSVELRGTYTWNGIIMAGDWVSISGPNNQEARLYGAIYIGNSSGNDLEPEFEMNGKASILYSSQAVNNTNGILPLKINYWKML
jgi:hypothetical protein